MTAGWVIACKSRSTALAESCIAPAAATVVVVVVVIDQGAARRGHHAKVRDGPTILRGPGVGMASRSATAGLGRNGLREGMVVPELREAASTGATPPGRDSPGDASRPLRVPEVFGMGRVTLWTESASSTTTGMAWWTSGQAPGTDSQTLLRPPGRPGPEGAT